MAQVSAQLNGSVLYSYMGVALLTVAYTQIWFGWIYERISTVTVHDNTCFNDVNEL